MTERERRGLNRAEAMRAARIEIGNLAAVSDSVRGVSWETWIQDVAADLRYAQRTLRRSPGFLAAVVLTLGLGIGASTAMFSVTHALLIEALPYPDADRLVRLVSHRPAAAAANMPATPARRAASTDPLTALRSD